jgi:hypothetical protein
MKLITTSWDDGHVMDFKLAELLRKYSLPATFYIPQTNAERPVMSASQIKTLAKGFEIGGHTLHHVRLRGVNQHLLEREIKGSYTWLAHLLGEEPVSFCFPGGVHDKNAVRYVFDSGYKLARTTQLFSINAFAAGQVTATTLQAYPHSKFTYAKHLTKYKRWNVFYAWLKKGSQAELSKLAESHLQQINEKGGCFHLWGHSWEIEKYDLWTKVEELFKILSCRQGFTYLPNKGLLG